MYFSLAFFYPNEFVLWSMLISLYPYITGLVAGAFIVSSIHHVFEVKSFDKLGRFALLAAFAFLCFATTPLLLHLGHPERCFNIMITPNPSSAMAGFGIIYNIYLVILVVEIWFVYREDIVEYAHTKKGIMKHFYRALTLGCYSVTEKTKKFDHKVIKFLACIGIPAACVLHGYIGFIFGALKANPWWSTSVMPIIFLMSAIISGIAALILLYLVMMKVKKIPVNDDNLNLLCKLLWIFMIFDVTMEILETSNMAYLGAETWWIIKDMITERIWFSFFYLQLLIGTGLPFLLIGAILLFRIRGKWFYRLSAISAFFVLVQVAAMRWNVVIGGQAFSKSFRGLIEAKFLWTGKEGAIVAIIILICPLILLCFLAKILPPWKNELKQA